MFAEDALALMQIAWSPTDADIPELNDELKIEKWQKGLDVDVGNKVRVISMQRGRLAAQALVVVNKSG